MTTHTIEAYRKVVHYLNDQKIEYHTYQLKKDKAFRVVLRHLHYTVPPEMIKEELQQIGFNVRNVTNIRHPVHKNPLPLFYVDLEPDTHNKNIFNVTGLLNTIIKVEEPYKTKEIAQCKRCQQYGHTRAYCHVAPRCVKCAGPHLWENCSKSPDTPPTCALCSGAHSSAFRGCEVHKELQRVRREREIARGHLPSRGHHPQPPQTSAFKDFPALPQTARQRPQQPQNRPQLQQQSHLQQQSQPQQQPFNQPATRGLSYSEITRSYSPYSPLPPQPPSTQPDITTVLNSFFQRFESLLTPLVNLLNTLVSQLLPRLNP